MDCAEERARYYRHLVRSLSLLAMCAVRATLKAQLHGRVISGVLAYRLSSATLFADLLIDQSWINKLVWDSRYVLYSTLMPSWLMSFCWRPVKETVMPLWTRSRAPANTARSGRVFLILKTKGAMKTPTPFQKAVVSGESWRS